MPVDIAAATPFSVSAAMFPRDTVDPGAVFDRPAGAVVRPRALFTPPRPPA